MLLGSSDAGRIENALGKGPVRRPPCARVVGREYLNGELFFGRFIELGCARWHTVGELGCVRMRVLKSVLAAFGHWYLILRPGTGSMLSNPSGAEDDAVVTDHREIAGEM